MSISISISLFVIRKKFQNHKLPLVDEVIELDKKNRNLNLIEIILEMKEKFLM